MTPSSLTAFSTRRVARTVVVLGSGLSVLALAAGCASTSSADPTTEAAAAAATAAPATADAGASAGSSSGSYTDGSYTASGAYVSPGGNESIKVELTLKSDVVTAVTVTPEAENPTAVAYEKQFASGISEAVVGKKIAGLNVGTVAGSSLTGEGFNKAVADIESQAKG